MVQFLVFNPILHITFTFSYVFYTRGTTTPHSPGSVTSLVHNLLAANESQVTTLAITITDGHSHICTWDRYVPDSHSSNKQSESGLLDETLWIVCVDGEVSRSSIVLEFDLGSQKLL